MFPITTTHLHRHAGLPNRIPYVSSCLQTIVGEYRSAPCDTSYSHTYTYAIPSPSPPQYIFSRIPFNPPARLVLSFLFICLFGGFSSRPDAFWNSPPRFFLHYFPALLPRYSPLHSRSKLTLHVCCSTNMYYCVFIFVFLAHPPNVQARPPPPQYACDRGGRRKGKTKINWNISFLVSAYLGTAFPVRLCIALLSPPPSPLHSRKSSVTGTLRKRKKKEKGLP